MSATLSSVIDAIDEILQDSAYSDKLVNKINEALQHIAGGIRMPNGDVSPPLPDLFTCGTVSTSTNMPYISLPDNYQRQITLVHENNDIIAPPASGNYYAFRSFLDCVSNKGLDEIGSVYAVAVKGNMLYYQGIPTASVILGIHYYRKPGILMLDDDKPEGLPDHLATLLLKHYVLMNIFGEKIEDGQDNVGSGVKYHTAKFYAYLDDLIDCVGIDAEPVYYGGEFYV